MLASVPGDCQDDLPKGALAKDLHLRNAQAGEHNLFVIDLGAVRRAVAALESAG